jgi:hypothetical protein
MDVSVRDAHVLNVRDRRNGTRYAPVITGIMTPEMISKNISFNDLSLLDLNGKPVSVLDTFENLLLVILLRHLA